jgi:hypothetical protein
MTHSTNIFAYTNPLFFLHLNELRKKKRFLFILKKTAGTGGHDDGAAFAQLVEQGGTLARDQLFSV